jgi:sugar phosphate isomerase/epimerase
MDVLTFVKTMDPRMGCCIDVGHCVRAGTDDIEAIHVAGPRLFNVHMKDLTNFTDKESQVAVGEGKMPIRQIFDALINIKYPGFVDLEYEIHADDPMPGSSPASAICAASSQEWATTPCNKTRPSRRFARAGD